MPKKLYCIDNRCSSLQLRDLYKTTLLATNVLSLLNHITRAYYRESIGIDFFSISSFFTPGKNTVGDFAIYFHLKFLRRKIARSWSSGKVKQNANKWYFLTQIVLTYCEKKLFWWSRKTFEIRGWRPRICKKKNRKLVKTTI